MTVDALAPDPPRRDLGDRGEDRFSGAERVELSDEGPLAGGAARRTPRAETVDALDVESAVARARDRAPRRRIAAGSSRPSATACARSATATGRHDAQRRRGASSPTSTPRGRRTRSRSRRRAASPASPSSRARCRSSARSSRRTGRAGRCRLAQGDAPPRAVAASRLRRAWLPRPARPVARVPQRRRLQGPGAGAADAVQRHLALRRPAADAHRRLEVVGPGLTAVIRGYNRSVRLRRPRLRLALETLVAFYVLALAAMPFAHHNLACHLKSSTHSPEAATPVAPIPRCPRSRSSKRAVPTSRSAQSRRRRPCCPVPGVLRRSPPSSVFNSRRVGVRLRFRFWWRVPWSTHAG